VDSTTPWLAPLFAFKHDLQQSLAYRRVPQWSKDDISFRSSVFDYHALSFLSTLSLGNVSALSVIALPIFKSDIANSHHYGFGDGFPGVASAQFELATTEPPTTMSALESNLIFPVSATLSGIQSLDQLVPNPDESYQLDQEHNGHCHTHKMSTPGCAVFWGRVYAEVKRGEEPLLLFIKPMPRY